MRNVIIRFPAWFHLFVVALVSSTVAYSEEHTAGTLLKAAVERYGELDRYACSGHIVSTKNDTSPGRQAGITDDSPSNRMGPPVTRDWYFEFNYARNESLSFYLYAGKAPTHFPLLKIETQPDGRVLSYNAVDTRRTGGIPVNYFASATDAANLLGGDSQWMFPFLLDLLEPERHFKLLEEEPKWTRSERIAGEKIRGVELKANTRKSIWIDPETKSILKVRYVRDGKARRSEIGQLNRRLDETSDDDVALGERLAKEIDALEDSRNAKTARFTYEFIHQSF